MPHSIRMMIAIENHLESQGCTILGPAAKKNAPAALLEQSDQLLPVGVKRFVRHKDQIFLVHVYIEDWPDRQGATVNVHTYGITTIKSAQEYPNFYKELAAGRFPHDRNISLFEPAIATVLQ